jgi:solute carrier family 8 (sodium/calcium exchanger)
MSTATVTADPCEGEYRICEVGGAGTFLPLFGEATLSMVDLKENEWPRGFRAILYLVGLLWMFLGVAIVADIFMGAIERITSQKKRVFNKTKKKYVTVPVWNGTVANLTLMALGSSAPEILLSIIELMLGDFFSGSLGASTIVGSAAFNLFCIIAVCIVAIPAGQVRYIQDTDVFFVTASSSVFAYVWLLVIVSFVSPDIIDVWEGVLTFLFFPILVVVSYLADKGYLSKGGAAAKEELKKITLDAAQSKDIAAMDKEIRMKYGNDLSNDEVARIMEAEYGGPVSRAAYRIGAIRSMVGGKRVHLRKADVPSNLAVKPAPGGEEGAGGGAGGGAAEDCSTTFLEFVSEAYSVGEACGQVEIGVRRRGGMQTGTVKVRFKTREGDATSGKDFEHAEGELIFPPDKSGGAAASAEATKSVAVKIINDRETELDESFYIELFDARCDDPKVKSELGATKEATIKIIDDDLPGELRFEKHTLSMKEETKDWTVQLKVQRVNGCNGTISCKYRTEDGSAFQSVDYEPTAGELIFTDGQETSTISVTVKSTGRYDDSDMFRVVLDEAKGTKFDATTDGGAESDICSIIITPDQASKDQVDHVMKLMKSKMNKAQVGHNNWRTQFVDAILVNGSSGDDEEEEGYEAVPPGVKDWMMHIITIFWKVLFAFIPPTDYCGGWLCFCVALAMIGIVTAYIGEMASLLGCVWGMPDAITAVTLVALGTSLPDTFASKTAAVQDEFADASIGNVTGSNSVNVFLGIGLPWMMGAFYWTQGYGDKQEWRSKYSNVEGLSVAQDFDGDAFVVPGGSLLLSVMTFSVLALICLAVLVARRCIPSIGGELGGPTLAKYASAAFLVALWVIFLIVYIINVIDNLGTCDWTTPLW